MPDPVDNFADGDTDLATGVVQTATEQAMGTEIMPGGMTVRPTKTILRLILALTMSFPLERRSSSNLNRPMIIPV